MHLKFLVALVALVCIEHGFGQQRHNDLERVLGHGYDWRTRPVPTTGGPTVVTVNIYIRRITKVPNGFEYELTLRQQWNDPRLAHRGPPAFTVLHPLDSPNRKIWMPDTFFQNAYDVKVHNVPSPNELVRVHESGDVLWSQKLQMTLPCNAAADRGYSCPLDFASYAYTTDDIVYKWKDESPLQQKSGLDKSMPNFQLKNVQTIPCTEQKTSTGTYSCLRFESQLTSAPSWHLRSKLLIIPLLLVVISWLPMVMNIQAIAVRAIIQLVCLSTLILHWSIIDETAHANGSDIWLTRCLGFIAATFVQLAIFAWVIRSSDAYKERKLAKATAIKVKDTSDESVVLVQTEPVVKERSMGLSLIIDMISLAIFILAFLVFLLHYFYKY